MTLNDLRHASQQTSLRVPLMVAGTYRIVSQIFLENRDFSLPHLHWRPPLGGFPSKYFHAVWYGKKLE